MKLVLPALDLLFKADHSRVCQFQVGKGCASARFRLAGALCLIDLKSALIAKTENPGPKTAFGSPLIEIRDKIAGRFFRLSDSSREKRLFPDFFGSEILILV